MDLIGLLRTARGFQHIAEANTSRRAPVKRPVDLFDEVVTHRGLATASRELFADGHYTRAVEQGFKAVNSVVKKRTGFAAEGRPLMERAFSPSKPKLAINALETRTETDEQTGTMMLFAGAMAAIRNVRTHDLERQDNPQTALELLAFANYLIRVAEAATVRSGRAAVVHSTNGKPA
ncbi:MAG: TIGR02391 family protein [Chloroflexi bacterium]|nr:TIGR02391 family protein [Chloroflexota bacterium]